MWVKIKDISLVSQASRLRSFFPNSTCSIKSNVLFWKGYLKPSELSLTYYVKIVYKREKHPNVYVLKPKPLEFAKGKTKLEHVYNTKQQHLCIYYKRADEWDGRKLIADTIIPWTSEWLLHYELWVATGIWHGGGIHL